MLKSLGRTITVVVAAVGIAVTPATGLAIAEPTDDAVVTTTPLPPPEEIPPPEEETPPQESTTDPPPATTEPPAEEPPPTAELPPADPPSTETTADPPSEEPPADPPAEQPPVSDSAEESPAPSEEPGGEAPSPETTEPTISEAPQSPPGETPAEVPGSPSPESQAPPPAGEGQSPAEQATETAQQAEPPAEATVPDPPVADQTDVEQAFANPLVVEQPQPVSITETDKVYEQIMTSVGNRDRDGYGRDDHDGRDRDHDRWDGKVRPWSHHWIKYDQRHHNGPVFCNPYHDRDIKIFYVHAGHQYVRVIPPRQSIVVDVDVRGQGMHSFTAVHVKAGNVVVDVNVGTFHHPAYVPPPVQQNVHVKVVVNNHYYPRPFKVKKVVDCGYDQVRRKTRVVFDDTYVAWGSWRGHGKDRHFALEESATYPGMYGKAQEVMAGPPEPYVRAAQPRNVAAETNLTSNEGMWIAGGALALALAIGMLARALIRRDKTPPQHL
jgi:hypothetical protein